MYLAIHYRDWYRQFGYRVKYQTGLIRLYISFALVLNFLHSGNGGCCVHYTYQFLAIICAGKLRIMVAVVINGIDGVLRIIWPFLNWCRFLRREQLRPDRSIWAWVVSLHTGNDIVVKSTNGFIG